MNQSPPTFGLILAGGLARRMGGGDKAMIEIGGVTILDRVLATLSGQCTGLAINANGDPERFADTGLPVIADDVPDRPGPLAGILAGSAWALLAGVMQSYLGVPLLIGSLLLNYPAAYIASYLVGHPFRDVASGLPQTFQVQAGTWLPFIPGTRLDVGIVAIIVVAVGAVIYANNTVAGYRARMNGLAPEFARASGLPVRPLLFQTLAISGAIAGLVGGLAVFGVSHRFTDGMLVEPLYAWTGIIAVLLVGMVPWAVPISGFFFAAVETGAAGMERTANVPQQVALIMQAVIILFVAGRISGASLVREAEDGDGL